ncbi:MAG: DUF998 domain-containing protein [Cyclobacteriaceae bacterium]|nr:DUF998 domain-containing protein [Cyclobacteriaceae bacterium]
MSNSHKSIATFSFICCLSACVGDFVVTFLLGLFYPGYDFTSQTESSLGTANSPVANYMNLWGVLFGLLLIIFGLGIRETEFKKEKWGVILLWLIILYGFGEGFGSGLFPNNHIGNDHTIVPNTHNVFGAIGGFALVLIPLAGSKIFAKKKCHKLNKYSKFVLIIGIVLIFIYLLSRIGIIPYKGLWQRVFILHYHIYLIVLGVVFMNSVKKSGSLFSNRKTITTNLPTNPLMR